MGRWSRSRPAIEPEPATPAGVAPRAPAEPRARHESGVPATVRAVLNLNLAVRVLLELAGVVALWLVGWGASDALPVRLLAAFALSGALVVAWGLVVAPKAHNAIPQRTRMLIGTALLLAAAGLWALAGQPVWAAVFAVVNVVNTAALLALGAAEEVHGAGR